MTNAISMLTQAFGAVKVSWRGNNQALVHAPHRPDKKPSLHLYVARNGNYRVHDYGTGEDMWLDEYIKRYTGRAISTPRPDAARRKAARPKAPRVDTRAMAKRLLSAANPFAEPYRKHGFTKIGENEDAVVLTKDIEFEGRTLRKGTALFVFRGPDGEPWGVQARAESADGKRMYWWPSKPEMGVGYSKGWRDATALVVAEGLPKAHAMARVMEEKLRNPVFLHRTGQRKPEEVTVGYIAIAGKGNFRKVVEDLLTWNRSLIILADSDVVAGMGMPTHPDTPEGIIKDVYAKRMAVNRRTTILGQGTQDINDLIISYGPDVFGMLKRIRPRVFEKELPRYTLPMDCKKLTPAGMQLLNAYWLYLLSRGEHTWKRGWTLTGSPTYADLAALSGLHMQTVKVQKRKLLDLGMLQDSGYKVSLKASVLRKCMLRSPGPPKRASKSEQQKEVERRSTATSNTHLSLLPVGSFLVVLEMPMPSQAQKSAPMKVASMGGYRRNGHLDFGSTGVWHYAMYLLYMNGWNKSEIAQHMGTQRRTVRAAIARFDRAIANVRYAAHEYVTRTKRQLWAMAARLKYLYDRYLQWQEGVKEAWQDAMGWLKVQARLAVHDKMAWRGPPQVQFMSYGYAL